MDVHQLYVSHQGSGLNRRNLLVKLPDHFGPDMLVLSGKGIASLIVFRSRAPQSLRLVGDEECDTISATDTVVMQVVQETKELVSDKQSYQTRINLEIATTAANSTLLGVPVQLNLLL